MNKLTILLLAIIAVLVGAIIATAKHDINCDTLVKYEDGSAVCTQNGYDNE